MDLAGLLSERAGRTVTVLNDADAAGLAEVDFGVAKGRDGVVIVTTLGTGIGSALFLDGKLVPNTEFGHLEIDGESAEARASSAAKEREGLSYKEWAPRLQRFYSHLDFLFSPDLIVVGGGISRKSDKFLHMIDIRADIVAAQLENQAGHRGRGHGRGAGLTTTGSALGSQLTGGLIGARRARWLLRDSHGHRQRMALDRRGSS